MNKAFVPGAVRRLGRTVKLPAIPRVKSSFKTLYLQCTSGSLARGFRRLGDLSHLSTPTKLAKRTRKPHLTLPSIHWQRMQSSLKGTMPTRADIAHWIERGAFSAGRICGTVSGLGAKTRPAMLFMTTAPVAEAILMEPLLRALAGDRREQPLCLWACEEVCEFYSAAPYLGQLRTIRRPNGARAALAQQAPTVFKSSMD